MERMGTCNEALVEVIGDEEQAMRMVLKRLDEV
jgi:hypothetical protein